VSFNPDLKIVEDWQNWKNIEKKLLHEQMKMLLVIVILSEIRKCCFSRLQMF